MEEPHPLRILKGNLTYVLKAKDIDIVSYEIPESALTNRIERDGEDFHITIVLKSEYQITEDQLEILRNRYDWSQFTIIGMGRASRADARAYYLIIWYPTADKVRKGLALPEKDCHVTIGFEHSDIHDIDKSINTLVKVNPKLLSSLNSSNVISYISDARKQELLSLVESYSDKYGTTADTLNETLKTRMKIHYALKDYDSCLTILKELEKTEDLNYIRTSRAFIYLQKREAYNALAILNSIPVESRNEGWHSLIKDAKYRLATKADTRVKSFINIHGEEIQLSRNFSWLIPLKLAGISIPKSADQIRAFEYANIGLVITVMEEERLPKEWFEDSNVENIKYSVPNFGTPTIEEMDEIISKIESTLKSDKAVLVHCGGGKGRAGTVLSCFVVKHGISGNLQEYPQMSAPDAIAYVREMRPGSVESKQQEQFVSDYLNHLYKKS